jgi:hypothetical protein
MEGPEPGRERQAKQLFCGTRWMVHEMGSINNATVSLLDYLQHLLLPPYFQSPGRNKYARLERQHIPHLLSTSAAAQTALVTTFLLNGIVDPCSLL